MADTLEITRTENPRVSCMGESDTAGTALGHPRVWLQIDPADGFIDCGYCDRRFILIGGVADTGAGTA
ncbi:MAG: zinc-finger domain-containing protein [Pseudomonadota bacterium]